MFVLAVASQKGGSGKTTLAGHLAVEAETAGAGPVALIDIDPQASLTAWCNARTATRPAFARVDPSQLREALEDMEQAGMQLTIVDTPPAITDAISRVMSCADLVLIPTRPSPHDLRAVGATAEMARQHRKAIMFVVNAATARACITTDAAATLAELGPVAPVLLHNRVDFASSMADGRTVGEMSPASAAAAEIRDLWRHVQERLAATASRDDGGVSTASEGRAAIGEPGNMAKAPVNGRALAAHDQTNGLGSQERRADVERRRLVLPLKFFGATDRRILPFGRRQTDRSRIGAK